MSLAADFLLRSDHKDVVFGESDTRAHADNGRRVLPRRGKHRTLTYVAFGLKIGDVVTGGRERALIGAQSRYTNSDEIGHLSAP